MEGKLWFAKLTVGDMEIITSLDDAIGMTNLGFNIRRSYSSISNVCRKLNDLGIVDINRNIKHKNSKLINLTKKGRKIKEALNLINSLVNDNES